MELTDKDFKPRTGRLPSSKEYEIGTKLFDMLIAGSNEFVYDVSQQAILIRLKRLAEKERDEVGVACREFSVQKESGSAFNEHGEQIQVSGYRVYRTK